jgi:hypothetical protein
LWSPLLFLLKEYFDFKEQYMNVDRQKRGEPESKSDKRVMECKARESREALRTLCTNNIADENT